MPGGGSGAHELLCRDMLVKIRESDIGHFCEMFHVDERGLTKQLSLFCCHDVRAGASKKNVRWATLL